MTDLFTIDFDWIPREFGSRIDRSTLAELSIIARGNCLTELEDQRVKTVRKSARVSAYALAEWMAGNWWRLRWEPERNTVFWKLSHEIGAAGEGYLWPDIAFIGDGGAVAIISRPTSARDGQPVRYLNHHAEIIPVEAFEIAVDRFIEAVIGRLESLAPGEEDLKTLWEEVTMERRDPALSAYRKLEACMGFDPDEAPDGLMERLEGMKTAYGESAVEEMAAASMENADADIQKLWDEARPKAVTLRMPDCGALLRRLGEELRPSAFSWQRAERAAGIVRDAWSIDPGPLSSRRFSEILDMPETILQSQEATSPAPMAAGFRDNGNTDVFRAFLNRRPSTGRRFALARLVAAHLDAPESDRLLPASDAATQRQKFQRAFAQELLCPYSDLTRFLDGREPGDDIIEDAADFFDVSPLLIRTTLVNKKVLDRAALYNDVPWRMG